jgi:hypothetical protein
MKVSIYLLMIFGMITHISYSMDASTLKKNTEKPRIPTVQEVQMQLLYRIASKAINVPKK